MTDALSKIGEDFEDARGIAVEFSFGGSNTLAGQIANGAPADAAIFAGGPPMDRLEEAGLLAPGTRLDALRNRLVVIGRGDMAPLESLDQIADSNGRVALADPELAPAGAYAREALRGAGLWDQLNDRLIPTSDVRAAAAAVESGDAEYGLVYSSDAAAISGVTEIMSVP
ncbi:MAG: molybdate ABC transporter substrate-binding protein, partial [Chloroflexota bacterium]